MIKLKQLLLCLLLLLGALVLSGAACEPEEEEAPEVDEAALFAINDYTEEMTAALPDVKIDLQTWSREPHAEDDLPFSYDEKSREWLSEHKAKLQEIRSRHLDTTFPGEAEIASWDVIIVRGEEEWQLDGEKWLAALERLEDLVDEVIGVIAMIVSEEGELDMEQSERVLELIEEIEPEIEAVRSIIFRT